MKFYWCRGAMVVLVCGVALAGSLSAQTSRGDSPKAALDQNGFTWTETYEGSGNSTGFFSDINSTAGYAFTKNFSVETGVAYAFLQPTTSKTGTTATSGFEDPHAGVRYAAKGNLLNYATGLTGTFPVASTAKGLSTGEFTYDWTNHVDHAVGVVTPFADIGVGNSISDTRFLHRPYVSLGELAHFEGGVGFDIGDKFNVTMSGYGILPWGTQKIFMRGEMRVPGPVKGGTDLTRDDGLNLGADYQVTRIVDLNAGYSRSVYNSVNTFSFGIGFNVAKLLQARSGD